jgi:hypothetical protein
MRLEFLPGAFELDREAEKDESMAKKSVNARVNPYDLDSVAQRRDQIAAPRPTPKEPPRPYELNTTQKITGATKK